MKYKYLFDIYKKSFSFENENFKIAENSNIKDLLYIYIFLYFIVFFFIKIFFDFISYTRFRILIDNIVFLFLRNIINLLLGGGVTVVSFHIMSYFMDIRLKIKTLVKCFLFTSFSYTFLLTLFSYCYNKWGGVLHSIPFLRLIVLIIELLLTVARFFSIRNYFIANLNYLANKKITLYVLISILSSGLLFILIVILSSNLFTFW